jgi:hypothetical protein
MSTRISPLRWLSSTFIAHASNVLPPGRLPWAEAMKNELEHIEGDVEALRWAAGCLIASYLERGGRKMNQSFGTLVRKPSSVSSAGNVNHSSRTASRRLHLCASRRPWRLAARARRGVDCAFMATADGWAASCALVLRDQVVATGSETDAACFCAAGWSCSGCNGARLFSSFVIRRLDLAVHGCFTL